MDQIYSEASLTIIAAAGEGPHYGLPGVANRPREPQRFANMGDYLLVEMFPNASASLRQSKWSSRAWTLQEGFLSKRRLIFDDRQASYVCGQGYRAESFSGELPHHRANKALDLSDFFPMRHIRSGIEHFKLVEEFLEEYTKRQLSHETDVMNACLGILNSWKRDRNGPVLSRPAVETHLWGIILRSSPSLLLNWYHPEPALRRKTFPTWSWTGWQGPIRYLSELSDDAGKIEVEVYANEYEFRNLRAYLRRDLFDTDEDVEDMPRILRISGPCLDFRLAESLPILEQKAQNVPGTYVLLHVDGGTFQVFRIYLDCNTLRASDLKDCVVLAALTGKRLPEERCIFGKTITLPRKIPPHDHFERVSSEDRGHLIIFGLVLKPDEPDEPDEFDGPDESGGTRFKRVGIITSELPQVPGLDASKEIFCNATGSEELELDAWAHDDFVNSRRIPEYLRTAVTRGLVVE